MTVAALRRLLAEIDTQGGPDAAREWRLDLPEPANKAAEIRAWAQQAGIDCPPSGPTPHHVLAAWQAATTPNPQKGTDPMTTAPAPALPVVDVRLKPPTETPELLTTSKLLRWAEDHPDPDIQDQGARAEAALTGLRKRYTEDRERAAIAKEAERLEARLAELRAREQQLTPAKPKRRKPGSYVRDYDTRTVRAWAAENGVDCPRVGQIPKRVLDAWRASLPQAG